MKLSDAVRLFVRLFLNGTIEINYKMILLLSLTLLFLNNILLFGLGYFIGNEVGYFTADSVYENKLILRDFNITRVCYENISDIIRLGQYNGLGLNQLKTTGTLEQKMVCIHNTTDVNQGEFP